MRKYKVEIYTDQNSYSYEKRYFKDDWAMHYTNILCSVLSHYIFLMSKNSNRWAVNAFPNNHIAFGYKIINNEFIYYQKNGTLKDPNNFKIIFHMTQEEVLNLINLANILKQNFHVLDYVDVSFNKVFKLKLEI